jgi:antirestriction protein ArdC
MDQEERNAQRAELLRRLGAQVEQLTTSDEWLRWLDVASRLHDYSFGNQMLIMCQRPDATRIAGYRAWQQMGRQVRKGEKGIKIFAPMVVKRRDSEDQDNAVLLFRIVHVFALEQTDGEPLPEIEWPMLTMMPDVGLYGRLAAVCDASGVTLRSAAAGANAARGWYEPESRTITVVESLPAAQQCKTLLHELAHSLDPGCHELRNETPRAERELVAESASYIVAKRLGLDVDDVSTHYVASWGGQPNELERIAGRVLAVAAALETAISDAGRGVEVAA